MEAAETPAPEPEPVAATNSISPRSLDAVKQQAAFEAKTAAQFKAKMQLKRERTRLKKEYDAKIAASMNNSIDEEAMKQQMEEQYKAEQLKAKEQMEVEYKKQMQKEMEDMKVQAQKQFEASLKAAQKTKELEMRTKQITKAMGLGNSVGNEAAKILSQINAEMLESTEAIKDKAKMLAATETLEETKAMLAAAQPDSQLDASKMQEQAAAVTQSIFENFSKMSEKEKEEMMAHMEVLKAAAGSIKDGDTKYTENLTKVQEGLSKLLTEQSALANDGRAALGNAKSPADVIKAFQENEDFVNDVKAVVCDYVKELVLKAEIPTVTAEKSWGGYEISGMKFASIDLEPNKLALDVQKSITVTISQVNGTLDKFDWSLRKTTFPKVTDKGAGTAKIINFSLKVRRVGIAEL